MRDDIAMRVWWPEGWSRALSGTLVERTLHKPPWEEIDLALVRAVSKVKFTILNKDDRGEDLEVEIPLADRLKGSVVSYGDRPRLDELKVSEGLDVRRHGAHRSAVVNL